MSRASAVEALSRGIKLGFDRIDADTVACGEMGIGNSTAACAVAAVLLGLPPSTLVGPGTGVDAAGLRRKTDAIEGALALHRPDPADPVDVLSKVGGFEFGVLAGAMIGGAAARRAMVVDGLISAAAALVAARLSPAVRDFMFASHLSTEPAHRWILADLGLAPMLDLELRLGEGTGAVLAMPLLDAACKILSDMATFGEAGVSGREPGEDGGLE
jgi:nicotinate-nucleotide--dimethylbenzimidazole phosphoribosyltransferase